LKSRLLGRDFKKDTAEDATLSRQKRRDFKTDFLTRQGNAQKIINVNDKSAIFHLKIQIFLRKLKTFFTICIKGFFVWSIQILILILTKLENGL
jgi:hypothetical protein